MDARMICGQDVRRTGIWPTDESRIDAFIQRHGGMLEASPVGGAAIMLRWQKNDGECHTVTGVTARDALKRLMQICSDQQT